MIAGEVVNGYLIVADPRVVGAGLSTWTYAERGGRQYFIKEFLGPTYPDADAPGSEQTKTRKRARCAGFEARHRTMQHALAPLAARGGDLAVTSDFFRWGAKYYLVTEKIEAQDLGPTGIAGLPMRRRLVLMKSIAHGLTTLHTRGVVHGDLKPSNILVRRSTLGCTGTLIDFDSSYFAGDPPPRTEIVGTINYYSPELLGYVQGAGVEPADLGVASDVFALGLVYAEFLTGTLPPFDAGTYHQPANAVRRGATLRITREGVVPILADSIEAMLLADPARRPTAAQVHALLRGIRLPAPPSSALRGRGLRISAADTHPASEPDTATEARTAADIRTPGDPGAGRAVADEQR